MTRSRPAAGDAIVAEVSIDGRPFIGRGTLVAGERPVAILTLFPRPPRPAFARGADVTDIDQEVAHG